MSTRYRSPYTSFGRRSSGNPYRGRYDNFTFSSPIGFTAFVVAVLVAIGTIVMAIIGIVGVAGGFDAEYAEPRYPKPDGYNFEGWRIRDHRTMCVDPRGGPSADWSLLDIADDAVATWRSAAPALPLTITGICKSAGGSADADGQIRWERIDRRLGEARGLSADGGDIIINPEIPTWDCVRNVLLHETGHVLGLDHQPDDVPSVMNRAGCAHQVTLIDAAAVRYLYEGRVKR